MHDFSRTAGSRLLYGRLLLLLSFLAFISLGLPDGLLGVAWPSISRTFHVSLSRLAIVQIAFTIGYLFTSTNAGRLTRKLGIGTLLIASNTSAALAMIGYVVAKEWALLILSTVILGTAGGAVDAALNAYAAERFKKEQVTLLHAFYGLGAMLGPIIMRTILQSGAPWQRGYLITLCMISALLLLFTCFRTYWYRGSEPAHAEDSEDVNPPTKEHSGRKIPIPRKGIGIALFLVYTGLEVTVGAWSFSLFTAGRGINPASAALWVGIYWAALTGGRLFFGFFGSRWKTDSIIHLMLLTLIIGSLFLLQPWWKTASLVSISLIGFSCAPLFPLFIALTPQVVGPDNASDMIGLQVAFASLGAAVVPGLVGAAVEISSIEASASIVFLLSLLITVIYRIWKPKESPTDNGLI